MLSSLLQFLLLVFFIAFVSLVLYLFYIHKINDHIPGPPRSSFFLGNLSQFKKARKKDGTVFPYLLEQRLKYGPIYVLFLFHRVLVVIGDARYVKEVFIEKRHSVRKEKYIYEKIGSIFGQRLVGNGLVTNTDHASWFSRRQTINPAFHRKSLKTFMRDFNEVYDRFHLRMLRATEGEELYMVKEFARLTLDVISKVSFNLNIGAIENRDTPFATAIVSSFKGIEGHLQIPIHSTIISLFQFIFKRLNPYREQIKAAMFLREFASEVINKRKDDIKCDKVVPNDLLTLLVKDETMSLQDMVDEFLTIFMAGQETTANSLAFTLYAIVRHPEIEEKIVCEIDHVLGSKECVEYDDLAKLKYLDLVLQESLRKYPVVGSQAKLLMEDTCVGGYKIHKGTAVSSPMYVFNHDPNIWKNPDIFDPDRFLDTENISYFTSTYFPFSIGDRNCLGKTFAKYESKVILARLLQKFKLELLPGQTAAMEARLTLSPKDGVLCRVTER